VVWQAPSNGGQDDSKLLVICGAGWDGPGLVDIMLPSCSVFPLPRDGTGSLPLRQPTLPIHALPQRSPC
jgi:hypothetical protein